MPKPKYKTYNHKKNIITEKSSKVGKIEPGNIVRFNYSGENVTDKRPLVLVLNPKLKGMLHGVNLNFLSEGMLKQIWKSVKILVQGDGDLEKLVEENLPVVKVEITNPRQFYNSELKKFLKSKLGSTGGAYRTYKANKLSSLKIIDYRFKGSKSAEDIQAEAEELRNK